jgi:hypothetical protein
VAGAYTNFEGFGRLNSADPVLNQHASVKERIARSIGEFDETKSLVGAEPFDNATDGWPRRGLEPELAEPESGAERISVELATPRITKSLDVSLACTRLYEVSWGRAAFNAVVALHNSGIKSKRIKTRFSADEARARSVRVLASSPALRILGTRQSPGLGHIGPAKVAVATSSPAKSTLTDG